MTNYAPLPGSVTPISASVERYGREKGEGVLLPADGSSGILCRQPALAAVGLDTLLAGAKVECEAAMGERGPEVSRILAVDFAAASSGTASAVRAPTERPAATAPRPDPPDPRANGAFPAEAMDLPGTVKFYNPVRGFGFVAPDGGGREVFVHASVLERAGIEDPLPGQRVLVRAESTPRGLQATEIEAL